jgi:hypothetical protein
MNIKDLLEELDGAGLALTDDDLLAEELAKMGLSFDTKVSATPSATEELLAALNAALDEVDEMYAHGFPEPEWAEQARTIAGIVSETK